MGCNHCLNLIEAKKEIITPLPQNTENDNNITPKKKKNKNQIFNSKNLILEKNEEFILEILSEINKYRIKHGVEELIYDEKITKIAQKYAEKCAREKELELSEHIYNDIDLGEILFCGNAELTPKEIIDIWYNEGSENYNYNKEPEISNNFTQLIWKNSKLFGLGHTLTKENKLYIVANFYPGGNIKGEYLNNIFPLINQSDVNSVYSINTKFLEEILNSHNEKRSKHNSPPLLLNPSLSTLAQNKAEEMAEGKKIKKDNNQQFGINLFFSKKNCNGEEVTSFWYKGRKKYDFTKLNNNINNDEEINNFTQLIWKNTKDVGFGFSNDNKGNFYVVAYYFPKGNIKEEYKNNVLHD